MTMKYLEPGAAPPITDFWGKANPANQSGSTSHSIAYHSLDVTAVGAELIARDRERLKRIAAAVGLEIDTLRCTLPFFLALHDIGKYARVFQAKSPEHWPVNSLGHYREIAPGNSHVVTGFQLMVAFSDDGSCRPVFEAVMPGWSASERKILFRALAGHHGRPPEEGARSRSRPDVCSSIITRRRRRRSARTAASRRGAKSWPSTISAPYSAGMNRLLADLWTRSSGVPRTRGDEPNYGSVVEGIVSRSPHARG